MATLPDFLGYLEARVRRLPGGDAAADAARPFLGMAAAALAANRPTHPHMTADNVGIVLADGTHVLAAPPAAPPAGGPPPFKGVDIFNPHTD